MSNQRTSGWFFTKAVKRLKFTKLRIEVGVIAFDSLNLEEMMSLIQVMLVGVS